MATTARGHIEQLPSGSFRVHVYAGTDPVTGKPRRLKQTCPNEASAAAALGKLLAQADGDHFPNREATLGQALAKYLEVADLEVSTREAHEGYIRRTIGPVLGEVKIRKLGADSLDSLYTALSSAGERTSHGMMAISSGRYVLASIALAAARAMTTTTGPWTAAATAAPPRSSARIPVATRSSSSRRTW